MLTTKDQLILEIAQRLETERKKSGHSSRREFALAHNLKLATYRNHELGESELGIHDIILYAEIMKVSTTWLLLGGNAIHEKTNDLDQVKPADISGKQEIGKRLEISRKVRGYQSRVSFSKACNMDVTTIRAHETGFAEIRVSNLVNYCFILDISMLWLLTGKGNPLTHHDVAQSAELQAFQLSEEIAKMQEKLEEISTSGKETNT